MTVLSLISTILILIALIGLCGVGIAFFGKWTWIVLTDFFHHNHMHLR